MNGQTTANFFARRGRRIEQFAGAYWHSVEKRMLIPAQYHLDLAPQASDAARFMLGGNISGLRYPSSTQAGGRGGIYVLREKNYTLNSIHKSQKRHVLDGQKKCEVRPVDGDTLLAEGLRLCRETMGRQGRYEAEYGEPKTFERFVRAIEETPDVYALGAFYENQLAAFGVCIREDGWLHFIHQFSRVDLLDTHCNHALCFHLIQTGMQHPEVHALCNGFVSLVELSGLHRFKLMQGYNVEPRNTVVQLHPLLDKTLVNRPVRQAIQHLQAKRPDDQRITRVATILDAAWSSKFPHEDATPDSPQDPTLEPAQ
jgi:hypothetical protein